MYRIDIPLKMAGLLHRQGSFLFFHSKTLGAEKMRPKDLDIYLQREITEVAIGLILSWHSVIYALLITCFMNHFIMQTLVRLSSYLAVIPHSQMICLPP